MVSFVAGLHNCYSARLRRTLQRLYRYGKIYALQISASLFLPKKSLILQPNRDVCDATMPDLHCTAGLLKNTYAG